MILIIMFFNRKYSALHKYL